MACEQCLIRAGRRVLQAFSKNLIHQKKLGPVDRPLKADRTNWPQNGFSEFLAA
jgi:hypothetical protein